MSHNNTFIPSLPMQYQLRINHQKKKKKKNHGVAVTATDMNLVITQSSVEDPSPPSRSLPPPLSSLLFS